MFRIHSADHDFATLASNGWKIAFEGNPEKLICEPEIKNNFGGGRKQTDDAHRSRVGDLSRCRYERRGHY